MKHLERVCEDCKPLTKREAEELNKITQNQYAWLKETLHIL